MNKGQIFFFTFHGSKKGIDNVPHSGIMR